MSDALREADYRVTVGAFRAFVNERPDDEKWELIDGEVLLNPAPTNRHQLIVSNLIYELQRAQRGAAASWYAFPGIGVTNPQDDHNQPEPDVMIVPRIGDIANWTSEVLATFEVLSPFTMRRDLVQKRNFYTGLQGILCYVVFAQDRQEATVFARDEGFDPRRLESGVLDIPFLGISLALNDIYRNVPLG